jgi:hypothetical protein
LCPVERKAEYTNTRPKTAPRAEVGILAASKPPVMAPKVVAISRNIPIRMFEKPFFRKAEAAPDEVAITETRVAPIA